MVQGRRSSSTSGSGGSSGGGSSTSRASHSTGELHISTRSLKFLYPFSATHMRPLPSFVQTNETAVSALSTYAVRHAGTPLPACRTFQTL